MKASKIRTAVAAVVFAILCVGLIVGINLGTLSGFGWETISMLCPLGAITTMIATKTLVPRAIVSLAIMAILVLLVGRAFCGWVCPVPMLDRIRAFFRSSKKRKQLEKAKHDEMIAIAHEEMDALSVKAACKHDCKACSVRKHEHTKIDSRHYILGGALISTAIFGFPVFCLVCPIGLTFATVLVIWRLFAFGDMTWSVLLVPAILVIELVFLRKWCTRFCPMAGLMNLVSRFSKTWRPVIDDRKCLETAKGTPCSRCAMACDSDINLRHPEYGELTLADCTRCRACVDACPTKAISMPFLPKKASGSAGGHPGAVVLAEQEANPESKKA